jgi:hypothetical protein
MQISYNFGKEKEFGTTKKEFSLNKNGNDLGIAGPTGLSFHDR